MGKHKQSDGNQLGADAVKAAISPANRYFLGQYALQLQTQQARRKRFVADRIRPGTEVVVRRSDEPISVGTVAGEPRRDRQRGLPVVIPVHIPARELLWYVEPQNLTIQDRPEDYNDNA